MKRIGERTARLTVPVTLLGCANAVGRKEGDGPLCTGFDYADPDDSFGQSTREKSEQELQRMALDLALEKSGLPPEGPDCLFAGDLLNQCAASSYAARDRETPYFGLYNACATFGEGLILAAMALESGYAGCAAVAASSHFCTAERQYRTPLEYGGQRTPTAQWTVTGAGAAILGAEGAGPKITHITPGRIVDLGVADPNNMGAAMAPAACDTITAHLRDIGRGPEYYDRIITGDLGRTGSKLLLELLSHEGISLHNHADCGCMIFDPDTQDVHAGGSGCGCCAAVFSGCLYNSLQAGTWRNILFCPTGALHSPTTLLQGESIPGICHALAISSGKEGM